MRESYAAWITARAGWRSTDTQPGFFLNRRGGGRLVTCGARAVFATILDSAGLVNEARPRPSAHRRHHPGTAADLVGIAAMVGHARRRRRSRPA